MQTFVTGVSSSGTRSMRVSPTGIWENLTLIDYTYNKEKNRAEFNIVNLEGETHKQIFTAPKPDANPVRVKILAEEYERFCGAFVENVYQNNVNIKWGEPVTLNSWEDLCNFYASKINFSLKTPFSLKALYTANTIMLGPDDSEYKTPYIALGNSPFISSEYYPAVLSITKDLANEKRPLYLTFTSEKMVSAADAMNKAIGNTAVATPIAAPVAAPAVVPVATPVAPVAPVQTIPTPDTETGDDLGMLLNLV